MDRVRSRRGLHTRDGSEIVRNVCAVLFRREHSGKNPTVRLKTNLRVTIVYTTRRYVTPTIPTETRHRAPAEYWKPLKGNSRDTFLDRVVECIWYVRFVLVHTRWSLRTLRRYHAEMAESRVLFVAYFVRATHCNIIYYPARFRNHEHFSSDDTRRFRAASNRSARRFQFRYGFRQAIFVHSLSSAGLRVRVTGPDHLGRFSKRRTRI